MRWRRRLLIALGSVFLLMGVLLLAAHFYLRSSAAARKVEALLAESLGVSARVENVSIGLFGSSRGEGVEVYEKGAESPWLKLKEIAADSSLLDVLRGVFDGQTIQVTGAQIRLRFDANNRLLTELPKANGNGTRTTLPAISLTDSELILEQEGHPPLVLSGIDARLSQDGDQWHLKGDLREPQWGTWQVEGELRPATGTTLLELRGDEVELKQERLQTLPFVLAALWKQVEMDGPANVVLRLRRNEKGAFNYRVEIEPLESQTKVTAIGLAATKTTGRIVAEDGLVTLRDLKGRASGGDIEARGDLDFRQSPAKLSIQAAVQRVDLTSFTRTWDLPQQIRSISGRLTGKADLLLTLGEKLRIDGNGRGRIEDARILGDVKTEGPIELRLIYVDGKPRFSSEMSFNMPRFPAALALLMPLKVIHNRIVVKQEKPVQQVIRYPAQAVSWLQDGVRLISSTIAVKGKTVMGWLPGGVGKPEEPPTYFEASFALKDIDLAQLVEKLDVEVPFPVAGRGSIRVKVALPIDKPNKIELYRLDGSLQLSRLKLADLEMEKVEGNVKLDRGILRLESLKGQVPDGTKPGSFEGTARMQLAPLGDVNANLVLKAIPLSRVLSVAPSLAVKGSGRVDATVNWSAPARKFSDMTAWSVKGTVKGDKLQVLGVALDQASAAVGMKKGELTFKDIALGVEGIGVEGTARVTVRDDYPYELKLTLPGAKLAAINRLFPEVTLPFTIEGTLKADAALKGTLTPLKLDASGSLAASSLKVGPVALASVDAAWKVDDTRLSLDKIDARIYEGRATGSAEVPLQDSEAGTVELTVRDLDTRLLGRDLKLQLEGEASGKISGRLEPATAGGEREISTRLEVESPKVRIQGLPVERLRGRLGYRREILRYRFEGDALGGRFEAEGKLPAKPKQEQGPEGSVRLRRGRLGTLIRALGYQDTPPPLRGAIDLTLDYSTDAAGNLRGDGNIQVSRLRWDRVELASRLSGPLRLRGSILESPEFGGEALGGSALFRVRLHLTEPDRSFLTATLERLETSRIAGLLVEDPTLITGPVDARLRMSLGREWRGGGEVIFTGGKVYGADVAGWHLPVRFSYSPRGESGQIDIDDTGAMLAMGRAMGRATFGWSRGGGMRLDGHVRFRSVELKSLLRPFADVERQFGSGRATGRFEFSGRDLRNVQGLTGLLEMDFSQTQALEMPVLRVLTPYLRGISTATAFEKGDLRATLSQGIWRVRRLTVDSRSLRLMGEGIVTVQGRLDLEVTARTGELIINPLLLRLVGLATGQPLPVEVLIRASDWLSNRVVHLRVGGTLKSPTVRIEPVRLLTEETVRFFIRQAAFPAASGGAN